jgi:flagellin
MRINTNMAALNAWRALSNNSTQMTKSLGRLSSGYRINQASDDAAGLAVSEKMRAQIRGLNMAIRNAQDGVSMVQTAEGGAAKIEEMLQRMRELAVQAKSGTLKNSDRTLLQTEFAELKAEIDRTANSTTFNDIALINSASAADITIQVGATAGTNDTITLQFSGTKLDATTGLGLSSTSISDTTAAADAISVIDAALDKVNTARATFGAYQNRLENAIGTLQLQAENITAAESRIRDVDMASEMANFTKWQILQQASQAMLAQANQTTQGVLSLLR